MILAKRVLIYFWPLFFGVLTGWALFDDPLKLSLVVGGVFIIAGIYLVNRNFTAKDKKNLRDKMVDDKSLG